MHRNWWLHILLYWHVQHNIGVMNFCWLQDLARKISSWSKKSGKKEIFIFYKLRIYTFFSSSGSFDSLFHAHSSFSKIARHVIKKRFSRFFFIEDQVTGPRYLYIENKLTDWLDTFFSKINAVSKNHVTYHVIYMISGKVW